MGVVRVGCRAVRLGEEIRCHDSSSDVEEADCFVSY
jgi:hypothetical protein